MNIRTKFILFGLIAIGFLTSLNVAYRRHAFEEKNKSVELAIRYSDAKKMAEISGENIDSVLNRLKQESHLTTIVLEEKTLKGLEDEGKVTILKGAEIINLYRVGYTTRHILKYVYQKVKVVPEDFYLNFNENAVYEFVQQALQFELGKSALSKIYKDEVLRVSYQQDKLMNMGLGFYEADLEKLSEQGFSIIPAISANNINNQDVLRNKFSTIKDLKLVRSVMFEGDQVFGYPQNIGYVDSKLTESKLNLVQHEFVPQKGMKTLGNIDNTRVLNLHSLDAPDKQWINEKVMVQRFVRAAKERRVNVLLLEPVLEADGVESLLEHNLVMFDSVFTQLLKAGFSVGQINALDYSNYKAIETWELILISFAVFAIAMLSLSYFYAMTDLAMAITFGGVIGLFTIMSISNQIAIYNRLIVILMAVCFPIYALLSSFPAPTLRDRVNVYSRAILYILKLAGISLIGAFMIAAVLSDINYLSTLDKFFGVKISFMVPLIVICLYYFLRPHRLKSIFYVFHRLSYAPVRTGALITVLFCIVFVGLFLLRSGNHIAFQIPLFELNMRESLEQLVFVRPRTKEFLIGYPFLIFAFIFVDKQVSRNWVWFFNGLGSVALISLINSFCHIHTPLSISLLRVVTGLVLGLVVGFIYVFVFRFLYTFFKRYLL